MISPYATSHKQGLITHKDSLLQIHLGDDFGENGLIKEPLIDVPIPNGTQLYNMDKDPNESENLATKYPEKVAEMEKMYKKWRSEMAEPIKGIHAK